MSEDPVEYNRGELKFIRLRTTFEDLVGYVRYGEEYLTIKMPLRVEIETLFDEGRQILSLQEYLPQSIIELKEIDILMSDVMFASPVKDEFVEQYEYVSDFFYNNKTKIKKDKPKVTELPETVEKVVSILEALQAKKDKPVH